MMESGQGVLLLDVRQKKLWELERIIGSSAYESIDWNAPSMGVHRNSPVVVYCDCPSEVSAVIAFRRKHQRCESECGANDRTAFVTPEGAQQGDYFRWFSRAGKILDFRGLQSSQEICSGVALGLSDRNCIAKYHARNGARSVRCFDRSPFLYFPKDRE